MAALEAPACGQEVMIFSRSSGGWVRGTVRAVDDENGEATAIYTVDGKETSKVVDWADPEQLKLIDEGQPADGFSAPPAQRTTWAASAGQVFDPDEDDYGTSEVINPLGTADESPDISPAAPGSTRNGVGHGAGGSHWGATAATDPPVAEPEALFRQKPEDPSDTNALLMWMKDMIENQHKDIAELRETVRTSVEAGGGAALSLIAGGGLPKAEAAKLDAAPQTREALIEFIHSNPVFTAAQGINPSEKDDFVELVAGRLERRFFYKDSMVIRKGADANEMFFLYKGVAEVYLDHPDTAADSDIPPVAKLKAGIFFGEAALLSEEPETRNAWIRAQCDMECYVLSADDLKHALHEHPSMAILFNQEKHRRAEMRREHLARFANGGGNFRRGFKVRLRKLGAKEQLAVQVAKELEEAFETVPEVFPRSAVEALLLDKMQMLESVRDQLAAVGKTEEEHGTGGAMKPPTRKEKKKIQMQMSLMALLFFFLTFIPFISEQHHSEEVLLAASVTHPALVHLNYYSEHRIDVKATVEGQPQLGIKQSSPGAGHHGRRLQREEPRQGPTTEQLLVCTDNCATAKNGVCEDREVVRQVGGTTRNECEPASDFTDCTVHDNEYFRICDPAWMLHEDEDQRLLDEEHWRREGHSTLQSFIVRCNEEVAEQIAFGHVRGRRVNMTEILDPRTPRNQGAQLVDEGHVITLRDEAQMMHVEFGMDGDMRNINHDVEHVYLLVITDSLDPIAMTLQVHDLGLLGPHQELVACLILLVVFGMIVFEVVHHTLAAMIGSFVVLIVLALQHRMPEIGETVAWMDHGTLALLWAMMIIVGVTAKTGVFEYMAVRLYKVSGGKPFSLLALLASLDILLSAFLDNVTTMLLLAPVAIQLCEAVGRDPRPYLMSLALFGNVGGTMTMIGDPPNIIIGNMLKDFVTFNDFIVFLAPGVLISLPTSFLLTQCFFKKDLGDKMDVNVEQLLKDNPIRNQQLLMKTGVMLTVVILGFFMHPITHIDPVWVAVPGAIFIFLLDDHHDIEGALHAVEWDTLIFFAALFVMVEGLAEMGLLRKIGGTLAEAIEDIEAETRQVYAIVMIMYVSAITSAFVDNIPFTTTMIPVIKQVAEDVEGVRIEPLIWSLAFGSCLGGMGTLIGASDNVVMAGIAEKAGYHVSFIDFMKVGFPFMLQSVTICTLWLLALNSTGIWENCDLPGKEMLEVCIEEASEALVSGPGGGHG